MPRFGIHLSIAGGLSRVPQRVHELQCNSLQIFSRNPRSWRSPPLKETEVEGFCQGIERYQIKPVVVHINYLVNLSSPDASIYQRSLQVFADDVKRCRLLGADYLVLHPGNHRGQGVEAGIAQLVKAINSVDRTPITLLLENTAGAGTELGSTFSQLAAVLSAVEGKVGICFDTCHAFVSGYDIRTEEGLKSTLHEFTSLMEPHRLLLIHANDARGELGSHRDHHQHIGEGNIGEEGFHRLLHHPLFRELPFILETPQKEKGDLQKNISRLVRLAWEG